MRPSFSPKMFEITEDGPNTAFVSLTGLIKEINEDCLSVQKQKNMLRACMADGHWGDDAARHIVDFWAGAEMPSSRDTAVQKTIELEKRLYELYGKPGMDEESDRTPEAAFTVMDVTGSKLSILAYGDCRLVVVNSNRVRFTLDQKSTWLGAFSYLKLRNRIPVKTGLIYENIPLMEGDYIVMFTDGLDECVYEKPTIGLDKIAATFEYAQPVRIIAQLIREVYEYGAEDNVSIMIHKFQLR